jgi:polyvinyl alcohol dehydrogenase (cytochrome)
MKAGSSVRRGGGVLAAGLLMASVSARAGAQDWPSAGADLSNTRHQPAETWVGPANVARLQPRWVFTTGGDVSATPAVVDGAVYVPDWAGNLFKIDAASGAARWTRRIPDYTGLPGSFARATPAVADGTLYVGTQAGAAWMLALDAATGELRWKTLLDAHPAATVTQSAVVHASRVYVGVASDEERFAAFRAGYRCCTFRGSVVALDATTGQVAWRAYTVPDNGGTPGGYSGVAVWGSTPVVDAARGALYVTTGNNYSAPAGADALPPDNHVDAVVALDLQTGAVRWSARMQGPDAWNIACAVPWRLRRCPDPKGPDYDFAQGAMLFTAVGESGPRPLLGAGQKSGIFWALDPASGAVVWSALVGPAGTRGGLQWGSATDGARLYVADANSRRQEHTLPSGQTTRSGFWSALDPATGAILWQTPVPGRGGIVSGPVTVANGVVYGGSMARRGTNMFALDAATGAVLWSFVSGGSVNSGPAVAGGTVFWGSGYSKAAQGKANDKLYAFSVPD